MVSAPSFLSIQLPSSLQPLVDGVRQGNRLALARAISVVENERTGFQALLHTLLSAGAPSASGDTGRSDRAAAGPAPSGEDSPARAARVGITGPPGAGKSSLVTAMARASIAAERQVGIVAVDPTSPYSGGALLGDRIRMNDLALDPRIFIRSMASRGSLGGLATTTTEVLDVMDAAGFDDLFVETVGVGQTELEIAGTADTVVVVLVPESGDGIQAMKAGLMEIADLFVVNKSDRPGADRLVRELRTALHYRSGEVGKMAVPAHHGVNLDRVAQATASSGEESTEIRTDLAKPEPWVPPVLQTMAQSGEGVEALLETIRAHRAWMASTGELERRRRARAELRIRDVMDRELKRRVRRLLADGPTLNAALQHLVEGSGTPYTEAARLLASLDR